MQHLCGLRSTPAIQLPLHPRIFSNEAYYPYLAFNTMSVSLWEYRVTVTSLGFTPSTKHNSKHGECVDNPVHAGSGERKNVFKLKENSL